jgi:hypothetical protein
VEVAFRQIGEGGDMSRPRYSFFSVVTLVSFVVLAAVARADGPQANPGDALAPPAAVQGVGPGPTNPGAPETYGLTGYTVVNIPPSELHAYNIALGYVFYSTGQIGAQAGDTYRYFETAVHIPTGALVIGWTALVYDNSATGDLRIFLWRWTVSNNAGGTSEQLVDFSTTGQPGYGGSIQYFNPAITWTNWNDQQAVYYNLRVYLGDTGSVVTFGGVTFWCLLQITPAPATATFNDVPTGYWAFRHIEALAASGITAGCGTGIFCPEQYVKRSEMAVYLAKALGLHWQDYP